jgi:hypothetical protein
MTDLNMQNYQHLQHTNISFMGANQTKINDK